MPTQHYTLSRKTEAGQVYNTSSQYKIWQTSPRVQGKLALRANPYTLIKSDLVSLQYDKGTAPWNIDATRGFFHPVNDSALVDEATRKFYGALSSGQAALGITMATAGQTASMIGSRAQAIARIFERIADRKKSVRKVTPQTTAGAILEYEFGWVPLLSDIVNGLGALSATPVPPVRVRGTASVNTTDKRYTAGNPSTSFEFDISRRVVVDAFINVENPNLWMLNKLGLLNPALVAWDLVPWSFLFGFVSNVNGFLNQFTATVGLELKNISVTETCVQLRSAELTYASGVQAKSKVLRRHKVRTVGSIPTMGLHLRVPGFDLETGVIGGALMVQNLKRLLH